MMDEIMESRCKAYEDEINALKAECRELKTRCNNLAESQEMTERTINALNIQNKQLIGELETAKRTIEVYEAQLDIVKMMCGCGLKKKGW